MFSALRAGCFVCCVLCASAVPLHAQSVPPIFAHEGEAIRAMVHRGGDSLPVYRVPEFRAGDSISFAAPRLQGQGVHWIGGIVQIPEDYERIREPVARREMGSFAQVPPGQIGSLRTTMRAGHRPMLFVAPVNSNNPDPAYDFIRRTVRSRGRELVDLNRTLQTTVRQNAAIGALTTILRTAPEEIPDSYRERIELLARASGTELPSICLTDQIARTRAACMLRSLGDGTRTPSGVEFGQVILGFAQQRDPVAAAQYGLYLDVALSIGRWLARLRSPGSYEFVPAYAVPAATDGDEFSLRLIKPRGLRSGGGETATVQILTPGLPQRSRAAPRLAVTPGMACLAGARTILPVAMDTLLVGNHYGFGWEVVNAAGPIRFQIPAEADAGTLSFVVRGAQLPAGLPAGRQSVRLQGRWGFERIQSEPFTLEFPDPQARVAPGDSARITAANSATLQIVTRSPRCVTGAAFRHGEFRLQAVDPVDKPVVLNDSVVVMRWRFPDEVSDSGAALVVRMPGDSVVIRAPILQRDPVVRLAAFATDSTLYVSGERAALVQQVTTRGPAGTRVFGERVEELDGRIRFQVTEGAPFGTELTTQRVPAQLHLAGGRTITGQIEVMPTRPYVELTGVRGVNTDTLLVLPEGMVSDSGEVILDLAPGRPSYRFSSATTRLEVRFEDDVASQAAVPGILVDPGQLRARFRPAEVFRRRVSGPLQYRVVEPEGRETPWTTLGMRVVRTPTVRRVQRDSTGAWQMQGANLDYVNGVAATPEGPQTLEECRLGSASTCLAVPAPVSGELYLWVRGLPVVPLRVRVPVQPDP
ncbi:MAG: hypothetical protein KY467_15060 [Gemmatimonadetes bacterium]|nr:hypothetical protein [Gemmatimonadota bacterium]